jgi:signal transduction histidine kinase
MNQTEYPDPMSLDGRSDLQTVLAAWQGTTLRLEQTHVALRAEVCRLTDELEIKNRELARKNRLADLGQMASHVAHEVRNNLVPVRLYTSLLRRRASDDSGMVDIVDKVETGLLALDATVNDLLSFTSDRDPQVNLVRVEALIEDVVSSVAPQLAAQDISTSVDIPPQVVTLADYGMLRRAVLNLVLNALDAMPHGGELVITAWCSAASVELEIADSGPGLGDEARERAFEPFFTTKSHGTGLGLAIVHRIAEVHGGQAIAANCPEGGAAFTLRLPRRALERAA